MRQGVVLYVIKIRSRVISPIQSFYWIISHDSLYPNGVNQPLPWSGCRRNLRSKMWIYWNNISQNIYNEWISNYQVHLSVATHVAVILIVNPWCWVKVGMEILDFNQE